jgi:hypothetical protein
MEPWGSNISWGVEEKGGREWRKEWRVENESKGGRVAGQEPFIEREGVAASSLID